MSTFLPPLIDLVGTNPPLRTPTLKEVLVIDYGNEPKSMQGRNDKRARDYLEARDPANNRKASFNRPSDLVLERAAQRRAETPGLLKGPDLRLQSSKGIFRGKA